VVTSTAVEATIPDVQAAQAIGARLDDPRELLAELFNARPTVSVSPAPAANPPSTGMIGWILYATGRDPIVMNGAVMKNFVSAATPFASALVGKSGIFVSEVDESDGSIARYAPHVAVLNNISLDHKTMEELRALFADFLTKAKISVVNADDAETAALAAKIAPPNKISYSLRDESADLYASAITPAPDGIAFTVRAKGGADVRLHLQVPAGTTSPTHSPRSPRLGRSMCRWRRRRRRWSNLAASGGGWKRRHGTWRHGDRRFRAQPGQDRCHPQYAARLSRAASS